MTGVLKRFQYGARPHADKKATKVSLWYCQRTSYEKPYECRSLKVDSPMSQKTSIQLNVTEGHSSPPATLSDGQKKKKKKVKWKVKICEFKPCIPGSVGNLEASEVRSFCKCLNCFPHHTLWAASVPPQLLWTSCNPASLSATATQRGHARISSHHTPPALARALLSFVDRRQINTFILIKRMNSLPHTCAFNAEKSPRVEPTEPGQIFWSGEA